MQPIVSDWRVGIVIECPQNPITLKLCHYIQLEESIEWKIVDEQIVISPEDFAEVRYVSGPSYSFLTKSQSSLNNDNLAGKEEIISDDNDTDHLMDALRKKKEELLAIYLSLLYDDHYSHSRNETDVTISFNRQIATLRKGFFTPSILQDFIKTSLSMTSSSTLSVAASHTTRASLRTLDKERIRQKALHMNMKEKLRMTMCMRIQKVCKKTPHAAQVLSQKVFDYFQQQGTSSNLSDTELQALVKNITHAKTLQMNNDQNPVNHGNPFDEVGDRSRSFSVNEKGSTPVVNDRKNSSRERDTESVYLTEAQHQQRSVGFALPPKKSPKKHKQGDIWNELVQYQSLVEAHETHTKQVLKAQQKSNWSSELEAQVTEKEKRRIERAIEDEKYFVESMKNLEMMNIVESEKERSRKEKAQEQNVIQEEQRQFKLKKKQIEADVRRNAEMRMTETIARQKTEEEAKDMARRVSEKAKMAQVLLENAELLEKKKMMIQADRELEVKLAEDYVKMEEQKDSVRQRGLEEMSKRIQAKMKFFDDTSKAEMDMKNKEDELRVLRYQADYEKRQMEIEAKKKHDSMERNIQQQEYLKEQIKFKKDKECKEKEEYNKQAEMWRKEREVNEKKERLLQQQRTSKNQLQQNWLRQQIIAKEQNALAADHTNLEVQINQRLLHKVKELNDELKKETESKASNVAAKTRQRSRELHEREKKTADRKLKDPRLKPATRK
ncbi:Aste57867_11273 [Aphanomyces stellatus]|uniref:Aste57867_11273 protein n=1 Tax=Aphanomyces stellatus TaxID=120398 RepID=A0A485KT61_9STRA|nr:hypothetical protein As57867_011231 [Aphanomyces stellatus]VFT88136.1 Aste57867_11273 [Aphanomyces stellatus]